MDDQGASTGPRAADSQSLMTIGELARRYNVTLRALRFYEARGMLSPLRAGATRLYDQTSIRLLEQILRGKQFGFTLAEIRSMVGRPSREDNAEPRLEIEPDKVLAQIELLYRQREGIDRAILELEATRRRLDMETNAGRQAPPATRAILTVQAA